MNEFRRCFNLDVEIAFLCSRGSSFLRWDMAGGAVLDADDDDAADLFLLPV